MTEKYKLIDIISYVNKDNKTIYLAVIYIVKGNRFGTKSIVVASDLVDILEQYMNKEISSLLSLEYNVYNNSYDLKLNVK